MAKTALAIDELESLERTAPVIDPARQTLQSTGFAWSEYMVRAPRGMIADDLKQPQIWRKVQSGPRGLRKFDRLFVVSFDEDWTAEAIVANADSQGVTLSKPRLTTMPSRYDRLFEDENFKVEWQGFGYVVVRKSDSREMTQPVATPELATRLLAQQYPSINR